MHESAWKEKARRGLDTRFAVHIIVLIPRHMTHRFTGRYTHIFQSLDGNNDFVGLLAIQIKSILQSARERSLHGKKIAELWHANAKYYRKNYRGALQGQGYFSRCKTS